MIFATTQGKAAVMGKRAHLGSVVVSLVVTAVLSLSACGGGGGAAGSATRSLDDVVRSIANSQEVDVAIVRTAVDQEAVTAGDKLRLAEQWESTLPARPLPKLQTTWDELRDYAAEQLRASTCAAIWDVLQSGEVPTGQQFFSNYIGGLATGQLPAPNVRAIMAEFDQLHDEAEAGTLSSTDIRFSLMQLRYC